MPILSMLCFVPEVWRSLTVVSKKVVVRADQTIAARPQSQQNSTNPRTHACRHVVMRGAPLHLFSPINRQKLTEYRAYSGSGLESAQNQKNRYAGRCRGFDKAYKRTEKTSFAHNGDKQIIVYTVQPIDGNGVKSTGMVWERQERIVSRYQRKSCFQSA